MYFLWWFLVGVYEIVLEIYAEVNQGVLFFFVGKEEATQSGFVCLDGRVFGPSFWFRPMAPGLFSMKTFRCFRFSNFILL